MGLDVVGGVIERNKRLYSRERVLFQLMPQDLALAPGGDLLVLKDVLQHLPNEVIEEYIRVLCPRFKACLITNSYEKLQTPKNVDILPGQFRCLDLREAPYFVRGFYVFEYWTSAWERIRTLLYTAS